MIAHLPIVVRGLAAAAVWTGLIACSRLPEIPSVDTGNFAPVVREQIQQAQREALSRPNDAEAVGKLGMILHAYRLSDAAMHCYRRAIRLNSADQRWHYYLGLLHAIKKQHNEAVAAFREALQRPPGNDIIRLRLAEQLLAAGNPAESRKELELLLAARPRMAVALFRFGKILEAEGQLDAAIEYYHRACGAFPLYAEARYALAQAYRKKGEQANAEQQLVIHKQAGAQAPPLPDALLQEIRRLDIGPQGHVTNAIRLSQSGRVRLAVRELEAALAIDPDHRVAHVNMIAMQVRLGNYDKAAEHYRRAIEIDPKEPTPHVSYANGLIQQGHHTAAAAALRKALENNPQLATANALLGECLVGERRPAEAERAFRLALDNDQELIPANRGLGLLLAAQGRHNEAIAYLEKGRNAPGKLAIPALRALSACYRQMGDRQRASQALAEARALASLHGTEDQIQELGPGER